MDTNIDFLQRSVRHQQFKTGGVSTSFIAENFDDLMVTPNPSSEIMALAAVGKVLKQKEETSNE